MAIDWNTYLASNPDLGAAGLTSAADAEWHYNTFGKNEGRSVAPVSDIVVGGTQPGYQQPPATTGGLNSFTSPPPAPTYDPWNGGGPSLYQTYSPDQWMQMSVQQRETAKQQMSYEQATNLLNQLTQDQRQALHDSNLAAKIPYTIFAPSMYDASGNAWGGNMYVNDIGTTPLGIANGTTQTLYSTPTGYQDDLQRQLGYYQNAQQPGAIVVGGTTPEYAQQQEEAVRGKLSGLQVPPPQVQPPIPQQPVIPPWSPPPESVAPFNPPEIPDTPTSGNNWRETLASGMGDQSAIYELIMEALNSGMSLSAIERDYRLNPGQSKALWDMAHKYATEKGLPVPYLPSSSEADAPYYQYGFGPGANLFTRDVGDGRKVVNPIADYLQQIYKARTPLAKGGRVEGFGGLGQIKLDPAIKRYVGGRGGGQQDNVPASLSPGEYVFDADAVAALGDGNSEEGARKLDQMRQNIRTHKRAAPSDKIPPKAKQPEQYLKGK